MFELVSHIVRTSAERDRTKINESIVEALDDLFHPRALHIRRAFPAARRTMVLDAAGIDPAGRYLRNAYLPDTTHCHPIEADPLLLRGQRENAAVRESLPDGSCRLVFPIAPSGRLLYLVDVTLPAPPLAEQHDLLAGLVAYFGNHVALLDYGETDNLTALPNRKTFDKHLFEVLGEASVDEEADADGAPFRRRKGSHDGRHWLAVCDIDKFKLVNDTHGHLMGDEVLVMFANLMRETFRYNDQLFRFGGEEFVVVVQPIGIESVHRAFDRFRQVVESHSFSRVGRVTASIGFSQIRANDTPPDVIDRADEALYYAKHHGRNCVACYEELVRTGELAAKTSNKGEIELF